MRRGHDMNFSISKHMKMDQTETRALSCNSSKLLRQGTILTRGGGQRLVHRAYEGYLEVCTLSSLQLPASKGG